MTGGGSGKTLPKKHSEPGHTSQARAFLLVIGIVKFNIIKYNLCINLFFEYVKKDRRRVYGRN